MMVMLATFGTLGVKHVRVPSFSGDAFFMPKAFPILMHHCAVAKKIENKFAKSHAHSDIVARNENIFFQRRLSSN